MNGRAVDNLDFDVGDLMESGAAVTLVTYRPSPDQAVLVVAANDVAAVEHHLRPQLHDRLCIVPSRWSRADIDGVSHQLREAWDRWRLFGVGETADENAQACVVAQLTRVTSEIADWAESQPNGLLVLRPWLSPALPRGTG